MDKYTYEDYVTGERITSPTKYKNGDNFRYKYIYTGVSLGSAQYTVRTTSYIVYHPWWRRLFKRTPWVINMQNV